jgi:PBP1b-binding outer membrane lipoprotein LpoB
MKKIAILSAISVIILFFTACSNGDLKQDIKVSNSMMTSVDTTLDKTTLPGYYTCTMHIHVIKENPGQCPICGIDLVRKQTDSEHNMSH